MINIYKQTDSANAYANLFIPEIPDNAENVCLLFIGHLETVYNILSAKPNVNFTVIDGSDTTDALPYIYNGDNLKERITFEDNWCEDNDTFIENLQTIFNNMSFDLIIANPPYGKGGNLAKEISKAMLKAADIVVCLQPTSCSKYLLENLQFIENLGPIDNYFTTNAKGLGTKLSIFKMASTKQNIYKSFDDVILDDNEKEWCRVVKNYNEGKGCFARMLPYLYDKKDFPYEEDLIFEIANWLPYCGVAAKSCKSQDYRHNFLHQPIEWRHGNQQYGMLFSSKETVKNFTDWWYKWENTNEGPFTLLKLILSILNKVGNGDPSINKYPAYFPNLDWSRPWTDQEILKELGLPEDFLEKEE